jgi:hypothetical protein
MLFSDYHKTMPPRPAGQLKFRTLPQSFGGASYPCGLNLSTTSSPGHFASTAEGRRKWLWD